MVGTTAYNKKKLDFNKEKVSNMWILALLSGLHACLEVLSWPLLLLLWLLGASLMLFTGTEHRYA